MNMGRAIRRVREDLGIEQRELAHKAGIGASYLSAIENGRSVPSQDLVDRIGVSLNLPKEVIYWLALDPPQGLDPTGRQACLLARSIIEDLIRQRRNKHARKRS
jgi:transcriptional regulator with XRE-family HTH domain